MKDYSFTEYQSAAIVLSHLDLMYTDLIDNGGIQFKILMNDVLMEKRNLANKDSSLRQGAYLGTGSDLVPRERRRA